MPNTPDDLTPTQQEALRALRQATLDRINDNVDVEARLQYLAWQDSPDSSAERRRRIRAVLAWVSYVWTTQYDPARAKIIEGDTTATLPSETATPCPFTFRDIAES